MEVYSLGDLLKKLILFLGVVLVLNAAVSAATVGLSKEKDPILIYYRWNAGDERQAKHVIKLPGYEVLYPCKCC